MLEAYRALDVAIWLRKGNDGGCRGVLEAMACGVPVVTGEDGAPPELAGETGRVVRPDDPGASQRRWRSCSATCRWRGVWEAPPATAPSSLLRGGRRTRRWPSGARSGTSHRREMCRCA